MRLSYTSNHVTDTVLVDDSSRRLYATTSSTFGRQTDVLKFSGGTNPSNLATIHFHNWGSDTVTLHGRQLKAKSYLTKPSWWSNRRVFTAASGQTYEWKPSGYKWKLRLLNGEEVARAHSRSLGLLGNKHPAYLELSDDPRVLNDIDELVATFVYVQIRRDKDKRRGGSGAAAGGAAAA